MGCGSLTSATSQCRLRTLQESPALPGPNTCRKNSAQSHTRSLPVTGVPQQPVQQPVQKPVQQPTPCQSEPQVLLPPVPSSPLTAQNWRSTATVFSHSLQRCVGAKLLRCCE